MTSYINYLKENATPTLAADSIAEVLSLLYANMPSVNRGATGSTTGAIYAPLKGMKNLIANKELKCFIVRVGDSDATGFYIPNKDPLTRKNLVGIIYMRLFNKSLTLHVNASGSFIVEKNVLSNNPTFDTMNYPKKEVEKFLFGNIERIEERCREYDIRDKLYVNDHHALWMLDLYGNFLHQGSIEDKNFDINFNVEDKPTKRWSMNTNITVNPTYDVGVTGSKKKGNSQLEQKVSDLEEEVAFLREGIRKMGAEFNNILTALKEELK